MLKPVLLNLDNFALNFGYVFIENGSELIWVRLKLLSLSRGEG